MREWVGILAGTDGKQWLMQESINATLGNQGRHFIWDYTEKTELKKHLRKTCNIIIELKQKVHFDPEIRRECYLR